MSKMDIIKFEKVKDIIKLRWISEIIFAISFYELSYSELLKEIEYISGTELQRKLNILVSNQIIKKNESTNRTTYNLTSIGRELHVIFLDIFELSVRTEPDHSR